MGVCTKSEVTAAVSTVGKEGVGLTYRGYAIEDLAQNASFEEVAYLLIYGALPNRQELDAFKQLLREKRELPNALQTALQLIPASAHPMHVLRTGCSLLGSLEPENSYSPQHAIAARLLATCPSILS